MQRPWAAATVHQPQGEPWFVGKDICDVLSIGNHRQSLKYLDDDEKSGVTINDPHGRDQVTTTVSESGLYSLILRFRKPAAKKFKRWITHEVLPTIRKTGAHMTEETLDKVIADPAFLVSLVKRI